MSKLASWRTRAWLAVALCVPVWGLAQDASPASAGALALGRGLYSQGIRADGSVLTGNRLDLAQVSGAAAACVNCHRPSGMGQVEGNAMVPPINGTYLYAADGNKPVATMDPHVSKMFNEAHPPYTAEAFAEAVRKGVNNRGRTMKTLMPRYDLTADELDALSLYLRQLSAQWSPGVTSNNIHFATVITPEVEPERRKVFIEMMRSIFRQKNGSTMTAKQTKTRHHMISAAELILGTERTWDLEIWELTGPSQTWAAQLEEKYKKQSVFALVSGLGDSTWKPVHDFCDHQGVPCWFPSVEAPEKNRSFYSMYFSGGVGLEADVLASHLRNGDKLPKRVIQIYREGDVAAAAAKGFGEALAGSPIKLESRILNAGLSPEQALRKSLAGVGASDAVLFWLRQSDIASLEKIKPVSGKAYFSSVLGKSEQMPLPAAWRANSSLIYLHELPEKRVKNIETFNIWRNISKIALVDQTMQTEVFFAMNFLTDTLAEMLDNMYRDYLVERAENMLSIREGIKTELEARDRAALGLPGDFLAKHGHSTVDESMRTSLKGLDNREKSSSTTLYPRLSLGPEQRFASKGGYIVQFAEAGGVQLVAESDFIVP
jgi:mono/diheme cytochrome c family protein